MGPLQALEETLADPRHSKEFADFVRAGNYDFIDFGCSAGGSIQWAKRLLNGTKGLGIDIDPKKVAATREAGFDAIIYDINKIPPRKLVRFTVLSHFLEHIPNLIDVKNFIRNACEISKDFILIKQPYFDADGYLFQLGLKTFWSDWHGHPSHAV